MIATEHGLELSLVTTERERRGVPAVEPKAFELAWRSAEWECYMRHSLLPHYMQRRFILKLLKAGWSIEEVAVSLQLRPLVVTTLVDAAERLESARQNRSSAARERRTKVAQELAKVVLHDVGPMDHLELAQWIWPLSLYITVTESLQLLRRLERAGEIEYELGQWRFVGRCAWKSCNRPVRGRSKYCSRNCSNKNARSRYLARKKGR